MNIAVTYDADGTVFQHFGRTPQFKIYEIKDGAVSNTRIADNGEAGHSALAGILSQNQVDTLICGGIGGGAQNALSQLGISVYAGVTGYADAAVRALMAGQLQYTENAVCDHHGEHHEGGCGHNGQTCCH